MTRTGRPTTRMGSSAGPAREGRSSRNKWEKGAIEQVFVVLGKANKDVQTSLRLSAGLYAELAKAAAANGRGIGEEIRARLENSFALDLSGPEERSFPATVVQAARHVGRAFGSWRENPFAFE